MKYVISFFSALGVIFLWVLILAIFKFDPDHMFVEILNGVIGVASFAYAVWVFSILQDLDMERETVDRLWKKVRELEKLKENERKTV